MDRSILRHVQILQSIQTLFFTDCSYYFHILLALHYAHLSQLRLYPQQYLLLKFNCQDQRQTKALGRKIC